MSQALESNVAKAHACLARLRGAALGHFINGEAVAGQSGETFENRAPTDGSVINEAAAGAPADIDRAAQAATEAFA